MLPLSVGATFSMTVSDSGLVYKIPVRVTAREVLKTVLGKVACFRVEPDVFGPGTLHRKRGKHDHLDHRRCQAGARPLAGKSTVRQG
jgi:hypothetical protein